MYACVMQEMCITGTKTNVAWGHTIFYRLICKWNSKRGECGVSIVLSPTFAKFHEEAGLEPPKHTPINASNFISDRHIEDTIKIKSSLKLTRWPFREKNRKKGVIIRLASVCTSGLLNEYDNLQDFTSNEIKNGILLIIYF